MARRSVNLTRLEIIQAATKMFMEKGYSNTSARALADELGISTGHLTFYFPTKEHLLAVLVEMLCSFQWKEMRQTLDEGKTTLFAVCLEFMAMTAVCEVSEIVKDFYVSAYSSPVTLEIIRRNDLERSKTVFREFCPDWDEAHFIEAETLVSGIEYATLMTTDFSAPLDIRIAGALDSIMSIYNVPESLRKQKIGKILAMDCTAVGKKMLDDFTEYIGMVSEQIFEEQLSQSNRFLLA